VIAFVTLWFLVGAVLACMITINAMVRQELDLNFKTIMVILGGGLVSLLVIIIAMVYPQFLEIHFGYKR